jgi:hypothetical protein
MMTAAAAAHVHVNSTRGSDGRLPVATLEASIPGRDVQTRAGGGPLPTRKKQKETDIWDLEKDQTNRLKRGEKKSTGTQNSAVLYLSPIADNVYI